jgi:hypothetical protein
MLRVELEAEVTTSRDDGCDEADQDPCHLLSSGCRLRDKQIVILSIDRAARDGICGCVSAISIDRAVLAGVQPDVAPTRLRVLHIGSNLVEIRSVLKAPRK